MAAVGEPSGIPRRRRVGLAPAGGAHLPPLAPPPAEAPYPPSVVADERVTRVVQDEAARAVRTHALRAHATQVIVLSEEVHALSNLVAIRTTAREGYAAVDPRTWAPVEAGAGTGLLDP